MATGDLLRSTKAAAGAAWGAVVGFVAPGVTYLLTVDGNGVSGTEWLHAVLISLAFAGGGAVVTGATVYAVENKPKPGVLLAEARYVGDPEEAGEPGPDHVPPPL